MQFTSQQLMEGSRCYLLPTRPLFPFSKADLLNKTFDAWKKCWLEVEAKTDFTFDEDDFYRQDVILSVVAPNEEIIGCHLYSFFNLENKCSNNSSFFKKFNSQYYNFLATSKIYNSFSIEYLTVTKKFRGNKDIPMGRAIISLSSQVLLESNFDGILAQTRDDLKVNKMTEESGGKIISSGFKMNGIDGSFVAFTKDSIKESPLTGVRDFKTSTWSRRLDLAGILTKYKNTFDLKDEMERAI